MKRIILVLIGLGLCVQARSESLSTTDGITYNNITTQRADPDGVYIEYTLPGGGLGMSKIKFSRLSSDQQKQFGYDANKSRDFEAKVAKAEEDFRQDSIRREQTAQAQRVVEQNREDQQAQVVNDRIMALAQLKQAEADLARATGDNGGYGGGFSLGGGYGYGLIALPELGNGRGFGKDLGFGFGRNAGNDFGLGFRHELLGQGVHRPGHYPVDNPSLRNTQRGANELGLPRR